MKARKQKEEETEGGFRNEKENNDNVTDGRTGGGNGWHSICSTN